MSNENRSHDIFIKETPDVGAEPASLGLFGLAVAALVLASSDLGVASASSKSLLMPWVLFFGATAQLIAGRMEFKRNNIFGFTVFTFFSMAMYSIATTVVITDFTDVAVDINHYVFGLTAVLIFLLIATAASVMTNKALFTILVVVDIAIPLLIVHYLWDLSAVYAGVCLLLTSILSFYTAGAVLLNTMAGRDILPLGSPIWEP
ncbi:MAG: acetate uptake transporter [Thermoplasmatota archaeon]